jgi:hypothetical protein
MSRRVRELQPEREPARAPVPARADAARAPARRARPAVSQLQRAYGNRSLARAGQAAHAAAAAAPVVQAKLVVTPADDRYEQEADRLADAALSGQSAGGASGQPAPALSRIQRSGDGDGGMAVDAASEAGIAAARGGGAVLPDDVRAPLEGALGHDLRAVRVHTDARADALSGQLAARAFTTGADVFFRQGEYAPERPSGYHLLAHELAHVVQQGGAPGAVQLTHGKLDPGADLPDLAALGSTRLTDLLGLDDEKISQAQATALKARELNDAWANTHDRFFMLDVLTKTLEGLEKHNQGVLASGGSAIRPPMFQDLVFAENLIQSVLNTQPVSLDAAKASALAAATDETKKSLIKQFFARTAFFSKMSTLRSYSLAGLRPERLHMPDPRLEDMKSADVLNNLMSRVDMTYQAPTPTKTELLQLSAELKKMHTVQWLLNRERKPSDLTGPQETESQIGRWQGNASMTDDIKFAERDQGGGWRATTTPVPPTHKTCKQVEQADMMIRRIVEPTILSELPPPKVLILTSSRERPYQREETIYIPDNSSLDAITHETGHYLENRLPSELWLDIHLLMRARHYTRVNQRLRRNPKDLKAARVGSGEFGMRSEGRYRGHYPATGKYTSSAYGNKGGTEMTAMSIEFLSTPGNARKLIDRDPIQAALILRRLRPQEFEEKGLNTTFGSLLPEWS